MKTVKDYEDIKAGMTLKCVSENFIGGVEKQNGVLHTNCMGWGWEPISKLDLDDVVIVKIGVKDVTPR